MAGFVNDTMFANNVDFTGSAAPAPTVTTDGELLIGSTATPNIKVGTLTSPGGSITIGYSDPDITLDIAGGGTAIQEVTVDDSTAPGTNPVLPLAGNINIFGGPGVTTTSFAANTFTINSVIFTDQPGSTAVTSDSGSFVNNAGGNIILDLPASPLQGELIEIVCADANLVAIDAPATHFIRIGTLITSAGGTATSTQIGDALKLRFRAADLTWYAVSVIGTWVMA